MKIKKLIGYSLVFGAVATQVYYYSTLPWYIFVIMLGVVVGLLGFLFLVAWLIKE